MADQKLLEAIEKYMNTYYQPVNDDFQVDREMRSIFDEITKFREQRKQGLTEYKDFFEQTDPLQNGETFVAEEYGRYSRDPGTSADGEFDVSTMQKVKIKKGMSSTLPVKRNIDTLMGQMDETFSQRLLRMIDERGMTDAEAYTKAYVDRRHFSKIRKDVNYVPNKKTVLAFTIALELSLDEAKDLLQSAGFALSRSSKTDIIVAYFLQHKIYDMFEINDVLDAYGQPVFL